jgi:hypothetical protein
MNSSQQSRFESLHPKLQAVLSKTIEEHKKLGLDWDILIVSGHRSKEQQDDCVKRKVSSVIWPSSAHNQNPSLACDLQGVRDGKLIDGDEAVKCCIEIAKLMCKIASDMGTPVKWGGLWECRVPEDAMEQIVKRNALRARKVKKTKEGQTTWVDSPHYELDNEWSAIKRDQKKLLTGASKK